MSDFVKNLFEIIFDIIKGTINVLVRKKDNSNPDYESTAPEYLKDGINEEGESPLRWVVMIIITVVAVVGIRVYIAKPFIVSGVSMYPAFDSWHYLIIDQYTYNFVRDPERGEVVVFKYPGNPERFFIKRIIGLPNEKITIDGYKVIINDKFELNEPYISDEKKKRTTLEIQLEEDEYFVMGDNRKESSDSRYWGPLKREFIVGRTLIRLFPFTKIDLFHEEFNYKVSVKR